MAQQVRVANDANADVSSLAALIPVMRTGPSIGEMSQPIPAAVLQLLTEAWQRTGGVSEFEQGFARSAPEAASYVHGSADTDSDSAFSRREIEMLRDAGLFEGLARQSGQTLATNAHAEHALADFCAEVYDAWDRLQGRLEAARALAARSAMADDAA